ncbi:hypothetical protein [Nocardia inohanensis]|uniref:hypothetical protein n=1 Tax=Nocardia inohanensis TaxID=209246 RepID=UPI00082F2C7E|nr:hypothetical protein [Nocardia inohanensis]
MNTRESEPPDPEPAGDGAYSGSWADWIEPAPEPVRARGVYRDYDSRYPEDDYDDYDDDYDEPAPARRVGVHRRSEPGRAWMVPVLGILGVLAVVAAIAVQVSKITGSQEHPTAVATVPAVVSATTTTTSAEPAAAAAGSCASEVSGGHVRGNGPGSTRSGPEVILALQNRYYVDRSGAKVREMYAPDAAAPSVAQIQAGIDSIPAGTTYCVQIVPGPFDGQHVMVVNETHPDSTKKTWPPQLVLTVTSGDRTLISAIVPLEDNTPR